MKLPPSIQRRYAQGERAKLAKSPVKLLAEERGIPVYQPVSFREDAVVETLRTLNPELIAVVAYGKILPQCVLDIPPYGCINIHGSLLPALRGSGPVQWAILNHLDEIGSHSHVYGRQRWTPAK